MERIRRTFQYIFDGTYPYGGLAKLDPHLIEGPFSLGDLTINPVPVLHGDMPVLGFRFGSAAYLTDLSAIPETSYPMLEGLEVLILDTLRHKPHPTHLTVEQSLAVVEQVKPQGAYLTHIAHELGHEETSATLPPHVRLAYDGLKLEVGKHSTVDSRQSKVKS
jgi:phosphoribosyl 1,2-cyclic phosphate phosphodiesterase